MIIKRANVVTESRKTYKHLDNPNSKHKVNSKQYKKISYDFFEELAYLLITTGQIITFPSTLGSFQIIKYKVKKDYNEEFGKRKDTMKLFKMVRKGFMSTNGYWCKVHWYRIPIKGNKYGARFKYSNAYKFDLSRTNKRPNTYNKNIPRVTLYEFFRETGWEIYIEENNYKTYYEKQHT
jgi:hypothetical protein